MTAKILLAKAIKQRTANYPWLDYEGLVLSDVNCWTKEISDFWSFYFWVIKQFSRERIDKRDFSFANKTVLVFALKETLSDYEFFSPDGELASKYKNNDLDDLYKTFLSTKQS